MYSPFSFLQQKAEAAPGPPPFTLSGITLYLDAGDSSSYPGSGNTWYDLSGNGNDGTLQNGAYWSSASGGTMVFDGVDDYVTFSSVSNMPTGSCQYTIVAFFNQNTSPDRGGLLGYGTQNTNQYLGFRTLGPAFETNAGLLNYWWGNDYSVLSTINTGTWYEGVARYSGTTRQLFKNDTSIGSQTATGINIQGMSNMQVGMTYPSSPVSDFMDGYISVVLVYNRGLSNTELTEIWDHFKGRYGY